jgi:hypothetical protein
MMVCEDGNYRESRWFSPWRKVRFIQKENHSKFDISHCVSIISCDFQFVSYKLVHYCRCG